MTDKVGQALGEDVCRDIESAVNRMRGRTQGVDTEKLIRKSTRKLDKVSASSEVPDTVKRSLDIGYSLIASLKDEGSLVNQDPTNRQWAIVALEYLVDPWDVIPDQVPEYGLMDDAYVLIMAQQRIEESARDNSCRRDVPIERSEAVRDSLEEGCIGEVSIAHVLPAGAGQHFASRAKTLNMLNGYMRGALYNIGKQAMYGKELSEKQNAFLASLLSRLIEEGMLDSPCSTAKCKHCEALRALVEKGKR